MTTLRGRGMLGVTMTGRWLAVPILALSLLASACTGGTETGNPSFSAALAYSGVSSEPERFGIGSGGKVAAIETAWLDLGEVRVSQQGSCGLDGDATLAVPALGIGDHAAGKHNFTEFEARSGSYCQLELPFVRAQMAPEGAPAELAGHSIRLSGALADGTPFTILSDAEPTIQMVGTSGGFELAPEAPDTLIVLDFAAWLTDLDWATATPAAGAITVSSETNADLLQQFEQNLASGVALYRDADGDGVLDDQAELLAAPP